MDSIYVRLLEQGSTTLWGLDGHARLQRMLEPRAEFKIAESPEQIPDDAAVLILSSNYLYDMRILSELPARDDEFVITANNSRQPAAVKTIGARVAECERELLAESETGRLAGLAVIKAESICEAYDPRLLKYDPPKILPVSSANRKDLEQELYDASYKGITDIVTKWLWPWPARMAVRFCVNRNISANQVTLLSLVLAIAAGLAFWHGFLFIGLLMGWVMTFLDTVDGKLARVTVSSSKIGDVLDHGLDLIHPPLWYLAWGMGIADTWMPAALVMPMFWIILAAYVGGRFCEGAFDLWVAPFRLFLWQPFDAYNRLITARRNPNMILLSLSLVLGRPDIGLYSVAAWHVLSTLILLVRVIMAVKEKKRTGSLETWLNTIDPLKDGNRLEVRLFTRLSKSGES